MSFRVAHSSCISNGLRRWYQCCVHNLLMSVKHIYLWFWHNAPFHTTKSSLISNTPHRKITIHRSKAHLHREGHSIRIFHLNVAWRCMKHKYWAFECSDLVRIQRHIQQHTNNFNTRQSKWHFDKSHTF